MLKLKEKRERYLKDPVPIRLGGLAANLARVKSFSRNQLNLQAVFNLIEESKYFIEWTASETDMPVRAELAELQIQLALWQRNWEKRWRDESERNQIADISALWSERILSRSGLLDGAVAKA